MDNDKIKTIKDIYDSVIPNLTSTDNNWKDFLNFSSQIWKHKFDAKILTIINNY